jgi:transposase
MELQLEELEARATDDEIAAQESACLASLPAPAARRRPVCKHLPEHLPRERVIVPTRTNCPCCGSMKLSKLEEDITKTLEIVTRS